MLKQVARFLEQKVERQIKQNGEAFVFVHTTEDKYHRGTAEQTELPVKGILHISTAYMQETSDEGATISSKPSPIILCLYEDGSAISKGDSLKINETQYNVTGVENVQQLSVVCQISLEEVQNG